MVQRGQHDERKRYARGAGLLAETAETRPAAAASPSATAGSSVTPRARRGRRRRAGRGRRTLVALALAVTTVTGTAGWAVAHEQPAITGPPPGAAAWRADDSLGRPLPDPATASPTAVARFFAGLTTAEQHTLAQRHPLITGNLDGAPITLRYEANERALAVERDRELTRARDDGLTSQGRDRARDRAERYAALLAGDRQILAFDPRDRGQVAEVYGDLTRARHTAVIVPGSDIDLGSYATPATPSPAATATAGRADGRPDGGASTPPAGAEAATTAAATPIGMATSLRTELARQAPHTGTAVISWTGYSTPVGLGLDAATGRLARAGAPRLDRFLAGLAAADGAPTAPPTVLCHSYGSVVCGLAAHRIGPDASDLVVLGSPGTRADSVADLGTSARVWAAKDGSDWIGKIPHVELFGLGHGADPAGDGFGARRLSTARVDGHAGYFAPNTESLRNFARITLGDFGAVRCAVGSDSTAADVRGCVSDLL
ncbi:alpha/beta hydrolase [Streptomyces sp. 71268]|uniref:alpha/beta hydrolase n=1 Tax=Streptomyces sp. 71268 TaxID=3002640 RepID=UPI0023F65501|nr:alpha/beta hydrolase [Streptomyces sp. 71268]WEV28045.1 alpha/beta hydrolase [Streptomyces sp. 71268]